MLRLSETSPGARTWGHVCLTGRGVSVMYSYRKWTGKGLIPHDSRMLSSSRTTTISKAAINLNLHLNIEQKFPLLCSPHIASTSANKGDLRQGNMSTG